MKAVDKRWQLFPIIILTISMVIGVYVFYVTLVKLVIDREQSHLTSIMSDVVFEFQEDRESITPQTDIDDYIGNMTQASSHLRIQVIAADGTVRGDTELSDHALARVENHADRPDFIDALAHGQGTSVRFSTVTSTDRIYVAQKELIAGEEQVIVLSSPMYHLKQMTTQLMMILIGMVVLSLTFLIGTSYVGNRQIIHRVEIEQRKQDERIKLRTNEIELMHRLANMLAACNNLVEAQKVVSDMVPRVLGDINGSVSLMRASRNQLTTQLDWGGEWPGSRSFSPDECWSLRKGRAHKAIDEYHSLTCDHMDNVGLNQTICIPLTAHGNTIGIMHLYFEGQTEIDPVTEQLAFSVSEHLGLALANLSLQEKLRSQALSDPLTGLFNRRFFEQKLEEHSMFSSSTGEPLSLLMLDLDHFKRFNDNFGHDAGDFVLKEIASLLKRSVGDEELACRLGGEELAILLPQQNMQQATEMAESICNAVRSLHLEHKGLSLGQLGVSIGVSTYPKPAADSEVLVKQADQALYMAKDTGRSKVVNYDQYLKDKKPTFEVIETEGEVNT